ncbi:MAG: hypothetical protein SWE60_05365 [Thermodesulfobacteriota bacterium]|nr:hypothetical protein [Thermodesulfobacteriota bacterium]
MADIGKQQANRMWGWQPNDIPVADLFLKKPMDLWKSDQSILHKGVNTKVWKRTDLNPFTIQHIWPSFPASYHNVAKDNLIKIAREGSDELGKGLVG